MIGPRGGKSQRLNFLASLSGVAFVLMGQSVNASEVAVAAQDNVTATSGITIPNSRRVDFVSKSNGREYSISIAMPTTPPPEQGYAVLYVLDGNSYFASAAEAVRANGNAPGVIVVGIGYPDTPSFIKGVLDRHGPVPPGWAGLPAFHAAVSLQRMYDLSLPATEAELTSQSIAGVMAPKASDVGGVDEFLQVVVNEVKPRVALLAKVDPNNQVLFGHSLGGLAVLRALFTRAADFRTFLAASPSIWWNGKSVLSGEPAFSADVASGRVQPRILITVGGKEEDVPVLPSEMQAYRPRIEAMVEASRMVGNACDLSARLAKLKGSGAFKVEDCAIFPKQDHGISVWPALGRGISFAFGAE